MSSDYCSIQEMGGAALAEHYPDGGQIEESHWHNAVLHVETRADGWLERLDSYSQATRPFLAVLSANSEGLRVLVSIDEFAIFIPWTQAKVTAARSWPATVIRITTMAVPSVTLVFNLDDAAADGLLRGVLEPLEVRAPQRSLAWWIAEPWVFWCVLVIGVSAGLIVWLLLANWQPHN
jgi:hypothetical protein